MKNPPSASVKPPTQTTQRVPMRSSKPGPGCDAAAGMSGIGGGAVGWLGWASDLDYSIQIWVDAEAVIVDSCPGRGGDTDFCAAEGAAFHSINSSRARNAVA